MRALVTGSAGHLGEALVRVLRAAGHEVAGLDIRPSAHTTHVASLGDRADVGRAMAGAEWVFHAATLHKPHIASHAARDFINSNIAGTLVLLEAAVAAGVRSFVFTSTTSVFGDALTPPPGAPAAWIDETVTPVPKNIYGVTKAAAEDLCALFHRNQGLACVVLRTSRFFPEEDDDAGVRAAFADDNLKTNEYLHRRVDIEDVVGAHLLAAEHAHRIGFGKFIVSATTPFEPGDAAELAIDAPAVVARRAPAYRAEYDRRGWRMFPTIGRVYDNALARKELGWRPVHDFRSVFRRLAAGGDPRSPLARAIGSKGYH